MGDTADLLLFRRLRVLIVNLARAVIFDTGLISECSFSTPGACSPRRCFGVVRTVVTREEIHPTQGNGDPPAATTMPHPPTFFFFFPVVFCLFATIDFDGCMAPA